MNWTPGQRVSWYRLQRGGYGYTEIVTAEVVRETEHGRVEIEVQKRDGTYARRFVAPYSLRATDYPAVSTVKSSDG